MSTQQRSEFSFLKNFIATVNEPTTHAFAPLFLFLEAMWWVPSVSIHSSKPKTMTQWTLSFVPLKNHWRSALVARLHSLLQQVFLLGLLALVVQLQVQNWCA